MKIGDGSVSRGSSYAFDMAGYSVSWRRLNWHRRSSSWSRNWRQSYSRAREPIQLRRMSWNMRFRPLRVSHSGSGE